MTTVEVFVDRAGAPVRVGEAHCTRQRGQISTTFLYDPGYLANDGTSIDPALPLVTGAQHQSGLVRAFADSAPDRWGRNLIEKAERVRAREERRAPRRLDDLDFLLGVSDDTRQGALRYRLAGSTAFIGKPSHVPRLVSLPELLRASDELASDEDPAAAVNSCSTRVRPAWAARVPRRLCASTMARWRSPSSRTPATDGTSWPGRPRRWICWKPPVSVRRDDGSPE